MDEHLESALIKCARNEIKNLVPPNYVIKGEITKEFYDDKDKVATVHVFFENRFDGEDSHLEKHYRFKLSRIEPDVLWHYLDSDG
jgi:hypothetical protein